MFSSCEIVPIITSDCLIPLLDITILSTMIKESVSIEAKTSIWTVLLARHVNNVLYSSSHSVNSQYVNTTINEWCSLTDLIFRKVSYDLLPKSCSHASVFYTVLNHLSH